MKNKKLRFLFLTAAIFAFSCCEKSILLYETNQQHYNEAILEKQLTKSSFEEAYYWFHGEKILLKKITGKNYNG